MRRRTGLVVLATTVLVCAAYGDPPPKQFLAEDDPPPLTEVTEAAPELPEDLAKIRKQFKSPLEGSILGKADENEFRAAYDKLENSAKRYPDQAPFEAPFQSPNFPTPTYAPSYAAPTGLGATTQDGLPDDLLTITLRVDLQAYQLDRHGEHELADELRAINQRIRERSRLSRDFELSR